VFTDSQKRRLLSPRLRKRFTDLSSWEAIRPIRQRFEEKAWEQSTLNWMTYLGPEPAIAGTASHAR